MKRLTLVSFVIIAFAHAASLAWATPPVHIFSKHSSGTSSERGYAVVTDGAGNVFVTGHFDGTANFGGTDLVSAGTTDIFLAKYSPGGVHLWSKGFGDYLGDIGYALATDESGNVFVTGYFSGSVSFGGTNLQSAGNNDIFLAKYGPDGAYLWSQRFGGSGSDIGNALATDGSGDVFMLGSFTATANFGGTDLSSAGGFDIVVAKYNAAGVHQWSRRLGGVGSEDGNSLATDGSGNVFVTGSFADVVDFGGGNLVSAGSADIFVAKYAPNGTHVWSQRFGGTGYDSGSGVSPDHSGNVLVGGVFQASVDFGGGNLTSAGDDDIFIAKYGPGGGHVWSRVFGGAGLDRCFSVATDESGHVFATGNFQGVTNVGGAGLTSAGGFDIWIAEYDADGAHLWSQRYGSTGSDTGYSVATEGPGAVLMTGSFQATVNFGGVDLTSTAGTDMFLVRYGPEQPIITTISDIGNDQGRVVKVRFRRSGHDVSGSLSPIIGYEVYRRDDAAPVSASGSHNSDGSAATTRRDDGWTFVGSAPAHAKSTYGVDVPTIGDSSIFTGTYYSVFFVRAATANADVFFDSPADSGCSVDNLAPGRPGGLLYSAGHMLWNESTDEDFKYFTVYGANSNSFAAATLIDYAVMARIDVSASPYVFYFVTATDFSGNESAPAVMNTLTGAGGTPSQYVLSISAYPNPFNPTTTIRYTVPSKGHVEVSVFDARGAHVATLVDEEKPAGAYTQAWNGRNSAGRAVSSGVYFARVGHGSDVRSYKLVLLK